MKLIFLSALACFLPLLSKNSQFGDCEWFEPRRHFKSRSSLIVQVNVVLNRTVVVDSD